MYTIYICKHIFILSPSLFVYIMVLRKYIETKGKDTVFVSKVKRQIDVRSHLWTIFPLFLPILRFRTWVRSIFILNFT